MMDRPRHSPFDLPVGDRCNPGAVEAAPVLQPGPHPGRGPHGWPARERETERQAGYGSRATRVLSSEFSTNLLYSP